MNRYPGRKSYYQSNLGTSDEIEQGDIFWGVPSLFAAHPEVGRRFAQPLLELPRSEALAPPTLDAARRSVVVFGDPVMVLPRTCDYYGPEKGRTHRVRLVGRIQRLVDAGIGDPAMARSGEGYNHTFFLPSWKDPTRDGDDMVLNFRYMTTVDASYLSRERCVARLSFEALIALRRRLAAYFTDYAPAPRELIQADQVGGLVRNDRDLLA